MKKFFIILMAAVFGLSMTSCLTKVKGTVEVKVVSDFGDPVEGETVYMYTSTSWDDFVRTPATAERRIITDAEGIANFNIQGIYFGIDNIATLYFAIYDKNGKNVESYKAVQLKAGETKTIELEKPIW